MTVWIPLLVPQQDYLDLAALVSRRQAERGQAPESPAETTVDLAVQPMTAVDGISASALSALQPWNVDDLRLLAASEAVTAQRWARAMDVCARHVGQFLSTQQIAAEAGMTVNEWRDAPRKITRHLASNYPQVGGRWPLAARAGRQIGHPDDQVYWAINAEQAARWTEVRTGLGRSHDATGR